MDPYRAYYEYPSSHAAIYATPTRIVADISPTKSAKKKRNWSKLLRLKPKKSKESLYASPNNNYPSQSIFYGSSPTPYNNVYHSQYQSPHQLPPQQNGYISPSPYGSEHSHSRNGYYQSPPPAKYPHYNNTYSRSSAPSLLQSQTGNQTPKSKNESSGKNTIRYTDWFGSVVARKPHVRPSLPMFPSVSAMSPGEASPTATWDNYMNLQNSSTVVPLVSHTPASAVVEIPAIYQDYCGCSHQKFLTKKKKKKCNQCGKKSGGSTVKLTATIGSSTTRIRPQLPPLFYQSRSPSYWAWPAQSPTNNQYSLYQKNIILPEIKLDSSSISRINEVVKSYGHELDSNDNSFIQSKNLTVPVKNSSKKLILEPILHHEQEDEDEETTDFMEHNDLSLSNLDQFEKKSNFSNKYLDSNNISKSTPNISITTPKENVISPQLNNIKVANSKSHNNNDFEATKNSSPKKKMIIENEEPFENITKPNIKSNSSFQYHWDDIIPSKRKASSTSEDISSQPKRKSSPSGLRNITSNHKNNNSSDFSQKISLPMRDPSKLVNIAGQRILLDKEINVNSQNKRKNLYSIKENIPDIGEWEPINNNIVINTNSNWESFNTESSGIADSEQDNGIEILINDGNRDLSKDEIKNRNLKENDSSSIPSFHYKYSDRWASTQRMGCKIEKIQEEDENEQNTDSEDDEETIENSPVLNNFSSKHNKFECGEDLSELLKVKSILKRPNSSDTNSETTESDYYLPVTSSDLPNNQKLMKKKSVQFISINDEDDFCLPPNSISPENHDYSCIENYNNIDELHKKEEEKEPKTTITIENNKFSKSFDTSLLSSSTDRKTPEPIMANDDLLASIQNQFPELKNNMSGRRNYHKSLSEEDGYEQPFKLNESSFMNGKRDFGYFNHQNQRESLTNLRRSHSQKEITGAPKTDFKDTYRLRKAFSRPTLHTFKSPLRPSVPPPPPPPPVVVKIAEDPKSSDRESSSPSPPPLPKSSPPPLTRYLKESNEDSNNISNTNSDPHSAVSISSRTHLVSTISTFNNEASLLSVSKNEKLNNSSKNYEEDLEETNPKELSFFLNTRIDGKESPEDGKFMDHIYEELPSSPITYSSSSHRNDYNCDSNKTSTTSSNFLIDEEKSIFDGASKYEILEFLQDARNRVGDISSDEENDELEDESENINILTKGIQSMELEEEEEPFEYPDDEESSARYMEGRSSNRSSNSESSENSGILRCDKTRLATGGEIERTDSGVGSETSKPNVTVRRPSRSKNVRKKETNLPPCDDCEAPVEKRITNSGLMYAPLICRRCSRRRQERKEILMEVMETEFKYGRDLKVMMDQFYRPMTVAGLLSKSQIDRIFLNIEDLIEHNRQFSHSMKDAYELALEQGDEDLLTVNFAKLFLKATPMLHSFQLYCVRQGAASILLQTLEKDRELLRIFLKVSQMENTLLRRMNLHSFLMVPIQRVTKYPLLLARLHKSTPPGHPSREDCRRAREKIELYLQHINNETKESSPSKLWRRISMSVSNNSGLAKWVPTPPDYDISIKLRAVTLEILNWRAEDTFMVREGRLLCLPPDSNTWTRRGKNLKMTSVQMVLVTLGRPNMTVEEGAPEDDLIRLKDLGIKEAVVLAFKDHRLTKASLVRDPWYLSQSVVTWDTEGETEYFEITDLQTKETCIFKDRECVGSEEWFRTIQFHTLSVGHWRKRRKALANIMINGTRTSI